MEGSAPAEGRKLATVQKIQYVCAIEGKDKIVLAKVLGYQLIVNKNDFFQDLKDEPLCVYFETDTVLDKANPDFAFLKSKKWRVRTMKMAGVYSEGLALPLSILQSEDKFSEGEDVTEKLNVSKYLAPSEMNDRYPKWKNWKKKGTDPRLGRYPWELFPKTDEPNLKSEPFLLALMLRNDEKITVTEKLDGMSATYFNGRTFSRNFEHIQDEKGEYSEHAIPYHKIRDQYLLIEKTKKYPHLAFQGEIVGPDANGNTFGVERVGLSCVQYI